MRDDFARRTALLLAQRVGYRCSNPECQRATVGPSPTTDAVLNIGVASHITAASPGGPRFDPTLSAEQRKAAKNGLWLCQVCAKLIDSDPKHFPKSALIAWKSHAEGRSFQDLISGLPGSQHRRRICSAPLELLSPAFTARDDTLAELAAGFSAGRQSQLLTGMGGVGKTQTMLAFAKAHAASHDHVLWVVAEDEVSLLETWRRNAQLLDIRGASDLPIADLEFAIFSWLRSNHGWLALIDNYEPSRIDRLAKWLVLPPTGRTLITSREQRTSRSLFGRATEVRPFVEPESIQFLFSRIQRDPVDPAEVEAAVALATSADGLPLVLEATAARVLAEDTTYTAYLTRSMKGSPSPGLTWLPSVERAGAVHPGAHCAIVILALLSPEGVSLDLIDAIGRATGAFPAAADSDWTGEAITAAASYSLAIPVDADRFAMHRVLQRSILLGLHPNNVQGVMAAAVEVLAQQFPEDPEQPDMRDVCSRLLPHVVALVERGPPLHQSETVARLLERAGRFADEASMLETSERLLKAALQTSDLVRGALDLQSLSLRVRVANLYRSQGRWTDSEGAYRDVLEKRLQLFGPLHRDVALTYNNLGNTLYDAGDILAAEDAYRAAQRIWAGLNEDHSADRALTMNGLGNVLRRKGEFAEAESLYRSAIQIWRGSLEPPARYLGYAINGLGNLLFDRGDLEAALAEYERADAFWRDQDGEAHPNRAYALFNLGRVYEQLGDVGLAEQYFDEAFRLRQAGLGERHPLTRLAHAKLARIKSLPKER